MHRVIFAVILGFIGSLLPMTGLQRALANGTWTTTGSLVAARSDAVMVRLADGDVLLAGGGGCGNALATAEVYHAAGPQAGTWTATVNTMSVGRYFAAAALLPDGKVLVAGGSTSTCQPSASADLYDPTTSSWQATSNMHFARSLFTATVLPAYNEVLVVGGVGNQGTSLTPELYSESGGWTQTGWLHVGRQEQAAALLPNDDVLVAGGNTGGGITASAEIFDPTTNLWTTTGSMVVSRDDFTATSLSSGQVLAVGGNSNSGYIQATAELYDPVAGQWSTAGSMSSTRRFQTATLLGNGEVLVAGGDAVYSLSSAELYVPNSGGAGTWVSAGNMSTPRTEAAAALLPGGNVLVAGGSSAGTPQLGAEVYMPASASNPAPSLSTINPQSTQVCTDPSCPATLTLTVNGSGFIGGSNGSVVQWNSSALPTTYLSSTQLTALIPASDLTAAATALITVSTPPSTTGGSDGGTSSLQPFYITQTAVTVLDSSTSSTGAAVANGSNTITVVPTSGNGSVTVSIYSANPVGTRLPDDYASEPWGGFFDVNCVTPCFNTGGRFMTFQTVVGRNGHSRLGVSAGRSHRIPLYAQLDTSSGTPSLALTDCALNGRTLLQWYSAATNTWETVSGQAYTPAAGTSAACITASFTSTSSPSLSDLTGTPFAVGYAPPRIGTVTTSGAPIVVSASTSPRTSFSDLGGATPGPYTLKTDWGDGTTPTSVSGIATPGTVGNGSHAYSAGGTYTLTVSVSDRFGQVVSQQLQPIQVTYNTRFYYNSTQSIHSGKPLPIVLQLLDAAGGNASSAGTSVRAVSIAQVTSSGTKIVRPLGGLFVYGDVPGGNVSGYGYVVSTAGLGEGNYLLQCAAGNDPLIHTAPFSIK